MTEAEKWYKVKVRRAGPGKTQLEITVPSKLVKALELKAGDYVLAIVARGKEAS